VNSATHATASVDPHRTLNIIKWVVYALLLVNFLIYVSEDLTRAAHTLSATSTALDWSSAFATTLDEFAWLLLIAMFELETYAIDDKHWTSRTARFVRGLRLLCFAIIGHTVYASATTVLQYQPTVAIENAASLCDLAGTDVSYVYNLEYTDVTKETCAGLANATRFYQVGNSEVISSLDGLNLERRLAWADLIEVVTWLVIMASIELVVRLQGKGIYGGALYTVASRLMVGPYLILAALATYWAYLSHWLYTWDTFVWIAGFMAIEYNVSEWRNVLIKDNKDLTAEELMHDSRAV
jgi:hypothetical protein